MPYACVPCHIELYCIASYHLMSYPILAFNVSTYDVRIMLDSGVLCWCILWTHEWSRHWVSHLVCHANTLEDESNEPSSARMCWIVKLLATHLGSTLLAGFLVGKWPEEWLHSDETSELSFLRAQIQGLTLPITHGWAKVCATLTFCLPSLFWCRVLQLVGSS